MRASRFSMLTVLALLMSFTGGCKTQKLALSNAFTCDVDRCLDGYVCHPETQLCVPPVALQCESADGLCPTRTVTGDACSVEGGFMPCSALATDCREGCRTCTAGKWTTCTTPPTCEGVRVGDTCSACENSCMGLSGVQKSKCDISSGEPLCKVLQCRVGMIDRNKDAADGCEAACADSEVCNGVDDDCNGSVDDNIPSGVVQGTCSQANSGAEQVSSYACVSGACALGACNAGFADDDKQLSNGCEADCISSGEEVCDGQDNNCDGLIDNVAGSLCTNYYADQDGDGVGAGTPQCLCAKPDGFSTLGTDCNDRPAPGTLENPSGENCQTNCASDTDNDGYCTGQPAGLINDCNPNDNRCATDCTSTDPVEACRPVQPTLEPTGIQLALSAPAAAGGGCETVTITATLTGGTYEAGRGSKISCAASGSQTMRAETFPDAASIAGFSQNTRSDVASGTCSGEGTAARLQSRGGTSGLLGSCNNAGARATFTTQTFNLTGWRQVSVSAKLAGEVTMNSGCGSAGTLFGNNTAATCNSYNAAVVDGCANYVFSAQGDNGTCTTAGDGFVDALTFTGTIIAPTNFTEANAQAQTYTATVTNCLNSTVNSLTCTYTKTTGNLEAQTGAISF